MITISLPGQPQGKGRARAFRRGSFIGHYTPEKTRTYEGMVRTAAIDAMAGRLPVTEPVSIKLTAIFTVPDSWSKKKRAQALAGELRPAKKPDADNIVKAWTDAMNGVVFRDDSQIVSGEFSKVYGPAAIVVVTVTPLIPVGSATSDILSQLRSKIRPMNIPRLNGLTQKGNL